MQFDEFEKQVKRFLSEFKRKILHEEGFHPAGVLIPFQNIDGEVHLLLTRRTNRVAKHKNQVAFPGGASEEGDKDIVETALRETEEEIGVSKSDVKIWGLYDDYLTISFFKITPVVGQIPYPYDFKLQADEIADIFTVPLEVFLTKTYFEEKLWEKNGHRYPIYYYYHGKYVIWGITAFIINSFIDKVFHFNPARYRMMSDERWKEIIFKGNLDPNRPHTE
jgi:8-oxo-dGTP pyrophosphatase MutT (NUDIX family)